MHGVVGHGVPIADEFVQIRLGGDMALFAGLGRLLLEADDRAPGSVIDRDFVDAHCAGFAEYEAQHPRGRPGHRRSRRPASPAAQLEQVAAMFADSERTVACWAMGLTQHKHAVPMISEITNVLLMRGMIGKPGAGLCPVRGHSQRAGRPHHGHLGEDAGGVPCRAGCPVRHRQPARARRRHRRRDPGDARRPREGVHGDGRQLRLGHPGHRGHRGGAAELCADGAGVDEAEPQPRRARRDRADPAVAGPYGPRRAGRHQTDGLR